MRSFFSCSSCNFLSAFSVSSLLCPCCSMSLTRSLEVLVPFGLFQPGAAHVRVPLLLLVLMQLHALGPIHSSTAAPAPSALLQTRFLPWQPPLHLPTFDAPMPIFFHSLL